MNAVGIIAEYNPFHRGHEYHMRKALELSKADCTVCVMSGNFLQRGEPALIDKWIRAEIAVRCGADLVVELPYAFAVNSARYFAMGGVKILEGLGCVDALAFGSESGSLEALSSAAERLADERESPEMSSAVRSFLAQGCPYPEARCMAVQEVYGPEAAQLMSEPNNILAIEYLKQCQKGGGTLRPITIQRKGSGYHHESLSGPGFASAKAIRASVLRHGAFGEAVAEIPEQAQELLLNLDIGEIRYPQEFYSLIAGRILCEPIEVLENILSVSEGLEHRLKKAMIRADRLDHLVAGIKSKRYPEARIRRMLFHVLLGLTKQDFERILQEEMLYARVLAFSAKGAELLRWIQKTRCASIPVLTNINRQADQVEPCRLLLDYDILASDLYHLSGCGEIYSRSDRVMKPFCGSIAEVDRKD